MLKKCFSSADGGRAHTLCRHGDEPPVWHYFRAREAAATTPCQDIGDAEGLAPREGLAKVGLAYQQRLVRGRDRRDTQVRICHRVRW